MIINRKTSNQNTSSKLTKKNALKMKHTASTALNKTNATSKDYRLQQTQPSVTNLNKQKKFNLHFASVSELIYSPFKPRYYLPPHLSSSQVQPLIYIGRGRSSKEKGLIGKFVHLLPENMITTKYIRNMKANMM